jgi:hypothetical protein
VGVSPQSDIVAENARLRASIDRAASAAEITLARDEVPGPAGAPAERAELCRQLGALRDRVAAAGRANEDPRALRAELATLLSFARMLQADADEWRATLEQRVRALERQRVAARRDRERLAADREKLVQRRDGLQWTIIQTAARMVQREGGEWRRTLPVFALGEGLTVCSVAVSCPRKGLHFPKQWLVTLNGSRDDVTIRRE